jgi:hypothetical protein
MGLRIVFFKYFFFEQPYLDQSTGLRSKDIDPNLGCRELEFEPPQPWALAFFVPCKAYTLQVTDSVSKFT